MGTMHRTMQGKMIDMEKLMSQNELMPAIGNVRVNARGDELGAGGKIIKKREDIMAEYYDTNPKAMPDTPKPVQARAPQEQPEKVKTEPVMTKKNKVVDNES
jgi:hypothetical protein